MIPLRSYLRLLGSHLRPHARRVAALAAALVVAVGIGLTIPQLLQRIIDEGLSGSGADLTPLALTVCVLAVALQLLRVTATWLAEDLGWRATNELRSELTAHVLDLDLGFHSSHPPGELIERVDGDVTALSNFFSAMIVHVAANALLLVGIAVLMARELWAAGLVAAVLMLVTGVVTMRLHGMVSGWWRAERASSGDAAGQVGEIIESTQDIAANGARHHVLERYGDTLRTWAPRRIRAWSGWGVLWGTSEVFQHTLMAAVFALGVWQLGAAEVASIYLLVHYADMIGEPLHSLRQQLADLQKAGGAIERIEALQATTSALPPSGTHVLPSGPLSLHLSDVTFTYADTHVAEADEHAQRPHEDVERAVAAPRVLREVGLSLAPGRVVGVLGRTGSGKTTLARLVARLYAPDGGTVELGGVPIGDVGNLRDRVAMVSQDVQVFAATVRDNLTMFDDGISDHALLQALDTMGLSSWFSGLPDGLDTRLGGNGVGLSSGQAQLLAFTRALLADPGLVILDEASSRLDPSTETLLESALDALLDQPTAIIIAHRLHTLERADDVLVMDAGRVVEFGDRRALAADPSSRYAQLLATGLEEVLA